MSGLGPTMLATPVVVALLVGLFLLERVLQRRERRAAVLATVERRRPAPRRQPAAMPSAPLSLVPPSGRPARRAAASRADDTWRSPAA